jgi:integrase
LTVSALTARYLAWVQANRAVKSRKMQALHLSRFGERFGSLDARAVKAEHLESFQAALTETYPPVYVRKHVVTVRSMFNRAVKLGWLPADFRPFFGVETVRVSQSPVLESDLMTPDEVHALLSACAPGMADLLRCYHATGARTSELIDARVGDYQPMTRQLVLGRHKREKTLRDPVPRVIALNDEANAIIAGRVEGRRRSEPLFTREDGRAWNLDALSHRVESARLRAGLREGTRVYAFRHLWISEALMAGVDVLLVARMAGTSVAMIERVYGHFRSQSLRDAQDRLDRARQRMPDSRAGGNDCHSPGPSEDGSSPSVSPET